MCDGKAKVWRAFVKDCSFQLQVYIGKAKHRIFVEKIQEETDCAKLLLMLNDLKTLAADAGDNPAHADLRQPFDYIKKHERLHQKLLRESARSRYTNLVAAIEAITASCSLSQDDAERAMGPAIQDAKDEFKKGIDADREDNKNHKPRQRFIDTSNDITKAWIVAVEQRRKALNCP